VRDEKGIPIMHEGREVEDFCHEVFSDLNDCLSDRNNVIAELFGSVLMNVDRTPLRRHQEIRQCLNDCWLLRDQMWFWGMDAVSGGWAWKHWDKEQDSIQAKAT
jgi:hypothetical protein